MKGITTGRGLRAEFANRGVVVGRATVFGEDVALELIARAEAEYVAIAGVEPIPVKDLPFYRAPRVHPMTDVERLGCWSSAREFVEKLSGRGLYFDVVLEPWWATYLARFKYLARTGAPWPPTSGREGRFIR